MKSNAIIRCQYLSCSLQVVTYPFGYLSCGYLLSAISCSIKDDSIGMYSQVGMYHYALSGPFQ